MSEPKLKGQPSITTLEARAVPQKKDALQSSHNGWHSGRRRHGRAYDDFTRYQITTEKPSNEPACSVIEMTFSAPISF